MDPDHCRICPEARQCRKPFSHSSIKTTTVLELLHIDIWGPYKTKTYTNYNFFLTILNDFTRYTWVHFIRYKSKVFVVLENFITYAKTQFKKKVLRIRSDNALELTAVNIKQFYLKKVIVNQTSCVYNPKPNGVVERKHLHLLETVRALFLQSQLPENFWRDNVLCAAYLINRIPLRSLGNIAPYFKLYNTTHSLDHLQNFGCLCYVSTSHVKHSKF